MLALEGRESNGKKGRAEESRCVDFHLDVVQVEPILPKARVRFDSCMALMVDERMKWERVDEAGPPG